MSAMKKMLNLFLYLLFLTPSIYAQNFSIQGVTEKNVAIYDSGEVMEFTLRVLDGDQPVAGKKIQWSRNGDDGKSETGEGVAGEAGLKITTSMDTPGFVRIQARAFDEEDGPLQGPTGGWGGSKIGDIFFDGGACVQPELLQATEEPEDFDTFWGSMRSALNEVPIRAERKELQSGNPDVKLYAVTIACAGPKAVTGYLTVPSGAEPETLPGIVRFHGYGIRKHNPPTSFNFEAIELNVNAHGQPLGDDDDVFKKLQEELKGYGFENAKNADREKTYYYGMALRVMRALQYVKSLPEWNGTDLQSNGGSQGGLQGLWGAGLDPDVTSSSIWSPWCCDLGGIHTGRMRGWRPDYTEALRYYDPVFHAKRIQCKVHLVANYGDYTCPPSGVWVVYNNIPSDNKSMEVKQGCTHSYTMKNYRRYILSPQGIEIAE